MRGGISYIATDTEKQIINILKKYASPTIQDKMVFS